MGNVVRIRSQYFGSQRKFSLANLGKIFINAYPTYPAIVPPCHGPQQLLEKWLPTSQNQMCTGQRRSKVQHSPPLWSFLWGDCSHPRPWLRKNIPLSQAKGHHVISSCAWKGSLEQVILILAKRDASQLRHDLFSVPRHIAQFPLLPHFPNCKREIILGTFLLWCSEN